MKLKIVLIGIALVTAFCSTAQEFAGEQISNKEWRLEIEPATFTLNGYSFLVSRNLTADKKLNAGIFVVGTDIPWGIHQRIMENPLEGNDLRMNFQLAVNARYKIEVFKEKQSNPYVGLIAGWEYFLLNAPGEDKLRIDVGIVTPYVGHEIYFFKQMVYVNPQIRSVFYLNQQLDDATRTEAIKSMILLPQVSFGVRL